MQIKIDDEVIYEVTTTDEKIMQSCIVNAKNWIKAGPLNTIVNKVEACMKRLDDEWVSGGKLESNGVTSIPTGKNQRANLIFSQPNYKDRATKDSEAQQI